MPVFTCTQAGCNKTFRTAESRMQHLHSPAHRKTVVQETQLGVKTAKAENDVRTDSTSAATAIPEPPQQQTPHRDPEPSLEASIKLHQATLVAARAKLASNDAHRGKADTGQRSSPKPASVIAKTSKVATKTSSAAWNPTNQQDTRWSIIPAAQHASAITSLKGLILQTTTQATRKLRDKYPNTNITNVPAHNPNDPKRRAIVLDCEMVCIGHNTSALARLSVIDYLTNDLLIDKLVEPLHKVTDWRTQWSGITPTMMHTAVLAGTTLSGSPAARALLFDIVDERTVIVGHALHNDFAALGIAHGNVVDSAELARKAVGLGARKQCGLKALCDELLGLVVQDRGTKGHDSVEDAFAAREVVLWCVNNPEELEAWGRRRKMRILEDDRGRKLEREVKRQMKVPRFVEDDSDGYGFLHLSLREFNELCGYPEWYDNWSD